MQILKLKEALQRTSPGVLTSDLEIFIENLNKILILKLINCNQNIVMINYLSASNGGLLYL